MAGFNRPMNLDDFPGMVERGVVGLSQQLPDSPGGGCGALGGSITTHIHQRERVQLSGIFVQLNCT